MPLTPSSPHHHEPHNGQPLPYEAPSGLDLGTKGGSAKMRGDPEDGVKNDKAGRMVEVNGLIHPGIGTLARLQDTPEQHTTRLSKIESAARTILECIGEDPTRPGLLDTPARFAKAIMTFTEGYSQDIQTVTNGAIFDEHRSGMVSVKDIDISSLCEHHLVPFIGKIHIGYIPNGSIIGLSKLARIANMFSQRLQVQERLTEEVADTIMEVLKPQGVAVMVEASHMCMVMRGVNKTAAVTVTSCFRGCFETNDKTRNEFFALVGAGRR